MFAFSAKSSAEAGYLLFGCLCPGSFGAGAPGALQGLLVVILVVKHVVHLLGALQAQLSFEELDAQDSFRFYRPNESHANSIKTTQNFSLSLQVQIFRHASVSSTYQSPSVGPTFEFPLAVADHFCASLLCRREGGVLNPKVCFLKVYFPKVYFLKV